MDAANGGDAGHVNVQAANVASLSRSRLTQQ